MIGEVSLGGVYLPVLVFLGIISLVVFAFLSALISILKLYRFFAYRPLVDLALLIIVMGLVVACSSGLQELSI
ncbi:MULTISPECIES: DUF1656 domain-containing protein [Burkholderiaceae]|uniref:DUF1656 domain-containing protein n=1 Tax=Burkholderiaceae TaxID=119060 RepID=UPI00076B3840|nr:MULTISPECIES: DUF1656 domain-containing protein [Burkholderiaceae]AME27119.1 hypothetical protein AXG89_24590 [Burkholderia sp. PAMC 26561]AME27736.1 hypothetical protein AXG89_28100 [Burkholderia sp. PAMC 26561]